MPLKSVIPIPTPIKTLTICLNTNKIFDIYYFVIYYYDENAFFNRLVDDIYNIN